MANNYRIEIKVAIVKCNDEETTTLTRQEDGRFTLVLNEAQAVSVDGCESALLNTNFAAVREALVSHFSAISLERALAVAHSPTEVHVKPYRVDGEVGRFTFDAHCVEQAGQMVWDTTTAMFTPLGSKEWYRTQGFKEIALVYGTINDSYRKTSVLLNRVRHQGQGGTPLRTLWDNAEMEGRQIQAHIEQLTAATLAAHGFTPQGVPAEETPYRERALTTLPAERVAAAIRESAAQPEWLAAMERNPVAYEDPAQSVSVAIDDVGVKQQKAPRGQASAATASEQPVTEGEKGRHWVHHTVARVAQGESAYILTGSGVLTVLLYVLAFLLHNHLLQNNLIFFVDGQRTLHTAILQMFAWFSPLQIILDWYHLIEKCKLQLSLAMKGREARNAVLKQMRLLLWYGCVDAAITTLRNVSAAQIKNQAAIDKLVGYFERHRSSIPCYAVRQKLDLRNSSQAGEKANDLTVSARQKHNGMSWRARGSTALAAITALVKNHEYSRWFRNQTLAFSFAA
jgi:hypothetical protein